MSTEQFTNNAVTTLNGAINNSTTSVVVTSATLFPTLPQFRIIIDSEIMLVTGVSGTTFTVTRGAENTTAASHSNGATVAMILTAGAIDQMRSDLMNIEVIGHRLTLTSGVPATTADVVGAGTIYLAPYKSTRIPLYNGVFWQQFSTSQISLALSITSGKNYDVFAFNNSGTITLELSAAWTNDTTRADALVQQDGVWVKSADRTRRYLGTIRASGTNTTEDSGTNRLLYNFYNQFPVLAFTSYTADSGNFPDQGTSFADIVSVTAYGQSFELQGKTSGVTVGTSTTAYLRILVDNVAQNHLSSFNEMVNSGAGTGASVMGSVINLSNGFHTFKLQAAKSGANTWAINASSSPAFHGAWLFAKPFVVVAP